MISSSSVIQFPDLIKTLDKNKISICYVKCLDLRGQPLANELGTTDYVGVHLAGIDQPAPSQTLESEQTYFCNSIYQRGGLELHVRPNRKTDTYEFLALRTLGKIYSTNKGQKIENIQRLQLPSESYY